MPKRKCTFNEALGQEFKFIKKCGSDSDVNCNVCGAKFSVADKGRSDILQHLKSKKHEKATDSASSSSVKTFFRKATCEGASAQLSAAEGTFCYHTIKHDQSFRSMDCTSRIIQKLFDKKFACARTKTESVVNNVLAPFALQQLISDLSDVNFLTVMVDASNHGDTKVIPLMVRYFKPDTGVSVKVLDVQDVTAETSDVVNNYILASLDKHDLRSKVVGLSADNTNTNFGGAARKGTCNVFRKLEQQVPKSLVGIGCSAHILNNCIRSACDQLPIDIEAILIKVYGFFQHHTVRVASLHQLCDDAELEYKKVLGYCATRWLSLMPAVERVSKLFQPLKDFFQSSKQCPTLLQKFLANPASEAWLYFIHSQASGFHLAISRLEAKDVSAVEAADALHDLRESLLGRLDECFVPFTVKALLHRLEENDVEDFMAACKAFYSSCIAYLDTWCAHFGDLQLHKWVLLKQNPSWQALENSLLSLKDAVGIDDNVIFDEVRRISLYASTEKLQEWNDSGVEVAGRWTEVFRHFQSQDIPVSHMSKTVAYLLCLPGTNAEVERVFSAMNRLWTSSKTQLKMDTLKAILMVKTNFTYSCTEFHDMLLINPRLLEAIHSSQKY